MKLRLLPFLFLGFWVSACGPSEKERVIRSAPLISKVFTDDAGNSLRLPDFPRRVISLAPNLTEMVYAIGAGDRLVARSEACNYPEEALFLPELSTSENLPGDSLLALHPDLVIVPQSVYSPERIRSWRNQGVPVFEVRGEALADVYHGLRLLGRVLGREATATQLADSLAELEARLVARTEPLIKYPTVMLVDTDPMTVAGGSGLLNELIAKAGGSNEFSDIDNPLHLTDPASVLAKNPEYLFLPSRDNQIYARLGQRYPGFYRTIAGENNQVFVIDPDWVYRPGPRLLLGLRAMAQALHSELADLD